MKVSGARFGESMIDVATLDVTAAGTSQVCADVDAVHFAHNEKAMRFNAADGAKFNVVTTTGSSADAIRAGIREKNNGAVVAIDAPESSLTTSPKCE